MTMKAPSTGALTVACSFVLWSFAATAQTLTVLADERIRFAEPLLIVAPDYPWRHRDKTHVEVRVEGRVTADGRFAASNYSTDKGKESFADAVRAVLSDWRFVPAVERCRPKEDKATLNVWFDIKDNRPSISASMDKDDDPAASKTPREPPKPMVLRSMPRIEYPTAMWRREFEGSVIALLRINKAGDVDDAGILAPMPVDGFNETVVSALRQAKLEPLESGACLKVDVDFCLRGGGRGFANPRCRRGAKGGAALIWY